MLFESVSYTGDLPFELSFLNVGEESKHCHKEIEILLVLRGVTHYQIYHTDYELNPGDLIIADVEDLHQIHDSSDDILLLSVHVDTGQFAQLYPNIRYMFFVCEECMEGPAGNRQLLQSKLTLLKHHIAKMAFDYTREEKDMPLLIEEVNELVSILVNHFQGFFMEDYQYKTSQENMSPDDLHRLSRITRYIMLNYNKKITLDDVSEMEHLSSYYASHLIKKTLGFNFQNFVNAIRLEFAEKLLVFSNMTLMQISQECGFSSPNYFNKCFSAWHGKTPAQYRKDYVPCERSFKNRFTEEEALTLLSPYLNISKRSRQLPQRTAVTPDFGGDDFEDFWENYAPRIVIDSLEAALKLGYYRDKIQRIRPAAFILDENLTRRNKDLEKSLEDMLAPFGIPLTSQRIVIKEDLMTASDAASAFDRILSAGNSRLFLSGKKHSLFTPEGLETPVYSVYDYFADLENPKIHIGEDHILVTSESSMSVLLFNTSPHTTFDVSLSAENLPDNAFLLRREITEQESCYAILDDLGNPETIPPLLQKRIDQCGKGKIHFSKLEDNDNRDMDFIIYHNTVIILEIHPAATSAV